MKGKLKRKDFSFVEEFITTEGDVALKDWAIISDANRTDIDAVLAIQSNIKERFYALCQKHFPEHSHKDDTSGSISSDGKYEWHIDPIDGTKNYRDSIPLWAISASLTKDGSPIYGIIYNPVTKQVYYSIKDGGAYLNGRQLRLVLKSKPSHEQLAIDFFMQQKNAQERRTQEALLGQLFNSFYRVRSIGNGSLSLAWLAQGHFSAYLSWGVTQGDFVDLAPGLLIAEEAGATVEMMKLNNDKTSIIVGSPWTLEYLAKLIDTSEDLTYTPRPGSHFTNQ